MTLPDVGQMLVGHGDGLGHEVGTGPVGARIFCQ